MNDFTKVSHWISEIEQDLEARASTKREAENRVAAKIAHISRVASNSDFTVSQEKLDLLKRLGRFARILEAENTLDTLRHVEAEVDEVARDQSLNATYYYGREMSKAAGSAELEEMKQLTTYQPPVYEWDMDVDDYDWKSQFKVEKVSFEDDGTWTEPEDMLDVPRTGPYGDFGPQRKLQDRDPSDY